MTVLDRTCDWCSRPFYPTGHYRLDHAGPGENETLSECCCLPCLRSWVSEATTIAGYR